MNFTIDQIAAKDWAKFAPDAHLAVFGETVPPEYDRIDFALLVVNSDTDQAAGYVTVRELDDDSVYLKHGGAFPPLKGTYYSLSVYMAILNKLKAKYTRITTLVENTNRTYMRMALAAGFTIIGIRNFGGAVLVELFLEGGK